MSEEIPKILHRVWVGPEGESPTETEYACYDSVYRLHPEWVHYCCGKEDPRREYRAREETIYLDYLFEDEALKELGINYPAFLNRILLDWRGHGNRYAIASDFLRVCCLYAFGGFYLDWDCYALQPLDDLRAADIVFAQIRESLVAEAVIGCRPRDPRIRDILIHYVETQQPERGVCCLNLSFYTYENNVPTYAPEFFIPHPRDAEGESLYRHTDDTRTVHCWRNTDYDLARLERIGEQLRRRNERHPVLPPAGPPEGMKAAGCYRAGVRIDCDGGRG